MKVIVGTPNKKTKKIFRMVSQWPKRTRALQAQFVADTAVYTKNEIVKRIPNDKRFKAYKSGLYVSEVRSTGKKFAASAIEYKNRKRKVQRADAGNTVLYVVPRRGNVTAPPKVLMLQQFSPWPVEMIPFRPDPKVAKVISRKVTRNEVRAIRQARNKDRSTWQRMLAMEGVKRDKQKRRTRSPRRLQAVEDVAFAARRLEEGVGGEKKAAHWKPAIIKTFRQYVPSLPKGKRREYRDYVRVLTDPSDQRWLSWPRSHKDPQALREKTTLPAVHKYKHFRDALGLRLKRS